MSVGVVMNQEVATSKKKAMESPSGRDLYLESIKLAPGIHKLLPKAELVSEVKSASDWSYSASTYASPFVRIVGDAGCFIDPFFSSGVHLALASGLSAAVTICAARKGECDELAAGKWHSTKVAEGYTRFLLVVLSALKQIRRKEEPVLSDWDEQGFDRAFAFFRPIIQGTADSNGKLTQEELSKTVDFCFHAFEPAGKEEREAVLRKVEDISNNASDNKMDLKSKEGAEMLEATLSPDEMRILTTIRARQMVRTEDIVSIEHFNTDTIDGMVPNMKRGELGLVRPVESQLKNSNVDVLAVMMGEGKQNQNQNQNQNQMPIAAH
ncbi:MAG: hypothetical protein Q9217_006191 [Psora testacea]